MPAKNWLLAIALVGALAVIAIGSVDAGGAPPASLAATDDCLGLACPDASYDVPEARGPVQSLSDPSQLGQQRLAGFYEYGLLNPDYGKRAVGYVIPPGQADRMPASIRNLPIVKALVSDTKVFEDGSAIFVIDRSVFGGIPPVEIAARTASSSATARGIRTRAVRRAGRALRRTRARAALTASRCPDFYFCVFGLQNLQGEWWGLHGNGTGWLALSACCNNFNDMAVSQQNRRNNDSLLNRNYPPTNGANDRYCADSMSEDYDLDNNFGGNGRLVASAWANTPDDIHC
jgi:hypothetical protein